MQYPGCQICANMENIASGGLDLVFDTNIFLEQNDGTTGLEMFKDLRAGVIGTLPSPVRLHIPYVVRHELRKLSEGKPGKRSPHRASSARAAMDFILSIKRNDETLTLQTKRQSQALELAYLPRTGSINDGLILLYSLGLRNLRRTGDVWLITNDNQLIARCARSTLRSSRYEYKVVGMTMTALKKAMELKVYSKSNPDDEGCYRLAISDSDSEDDQKKARRNDSPNKRERSRTADDQQEWNRLKEDHSFCPSWLRPRAASANTG